MGSDALKRCGRCGAQLPLTSFATRRASRDGLQGWCRECSSNWARDKRPRTRTPAPEVPTGRKWCRRCETVRAIEQFSVHRGMPDGRQTYCRDCCSLMYRDRREAAGHVVRPAEVPDGHKYCRGCRQVRPLSEWAVRRAGSDGYAFRCRECMTKRDRERYLDATYGLDEASVAELLAGQRGKCAICWRAPAIHVDHDHATGAVRGMLCFRCNAALGQLDDDVDRLHRAADYLQGRRLVIRSPHPGVFLISRTNPLPQPRPHAEAGRREVVDIAALRAKARGA